MSMTDDKPPKPTSTSSTATPPSEAKPPRFDAKTADEQTYERERERRFGKRGDLAPDRLPESRIV
jgi:hypothetical protein